MTDDKLSRLALLRRPFESHQISKLPKPYKKDSPKGQCKECGGYHGLPALHLDYVGHAALTDRLLEVDPEWNWEPLAVDDRGIPVVDKDGGMWIKLTICGVSRLGYGDSQEKTGANATKERIGDALRNAAMRFGAALDLWHKGILHVDDEPATEPEKIEVLSDDSFYKLLYFIVDAETIDDIKKVLSTAKHRNANSYQMAALTAEATKRKLELTGE